VSVGDLIRYKEWYDTLDTLKQTVKVGKVFFNWTGAASGKAGSYFWERV